MGFEFEDKDVKPFDKFAGIRNNVGPESFDTGDLVTATNVDITDENKLQRRKGYAKVATGSYHSLWSSGDICLVMSGGTMSRYNADDTLTSIGTGYTAAAPMSYGVIGNRVMFSNGIESGIYDGTVRPWGIAVPTHQPTATVIGGSLPAGLYQYAMTYTRADGSESGTGLAGVIELTTTGGIGFSNLPASADSTVTGRNLYISPVNGDNMYRLMHFSTSETAAVYSFERTGSLPLNTQHLSPPNPGTIVAVHNGVVYVASGSTLFHSLPYAPELFDLRQNFKFTSPITMVAPVSGGIFVGTEDEIVYLPGSSPDQFKVDIKATYGVIKGSLCYGQAADINPEAIGVAIFFASTEGLCVGFQDGGFRNITRNRFLYRSTDRAVSIVRPHNGMMQQITILQGAGAPANAAF